MNDYAELEIGLHRRDAGHRDTAWRYQVEFRFTRPDSDTEDRLSPGHDALTVQFDIEGLRTLMLDEAAYGQRLTASLFNSEATRMAFEKARTAAQSLDAPLRIRLFVGASAPELHALRWETLRDPQQNDRRLLTDERMLFSRYLGSFDWRPIRLRPQSDLRALAVVASPSDLADYGMSALDVNGEIARINTGLSNVAVTAIESGGASTLDNIITQLRDGYDILYLVAHGMFVENEPWLWLETDAGDTQRVSGSELITRLQDLEQRPRLVILSSCQSAGTGEDTEIGQQGILAALGPRLAQAGIPAVIAMQGFITIATVEQFLPVFFKELQQDGQIDRAMAVARGAVREHPDWWMPALFMRLKSGRLWYAPGFAEEQGGLEKWPAVLRNITRKRCTPILGPGLTESLIGTMRDMARLWAEKYHFPLAPYLKEDLPQVAQFLAIQQDPMFPRDELETTLEMAITQRYGDSLPPDVQGAPLDEMIAAIGRQQREADPHQPHRVLASLPLPIFITTDPTNELKQALIDAGKEPQTELCRWNSYLEDLPSIYDDEPNFRPTEQRPLIYHLFGTLDEPDSLVLTEDDYFDYLIGVTSNKDLIPAVVRRALVDTALLFLGFQMEDWNFRVLFRSIMSREGRSRRRDYAHVAAQVTPEEGRILEPERARRYLEQYFQDTNISMYWGSVEDFTKELAQQLSA